MLGKRSQTHKIICMKSLEQANPKDRKQVSDCQGLEIRKQGVIANGFGVSFCGDVINVLELGSGDDCTTFEYAKNHEFYTMKG